MNESDAMEDIFYHVMRTQQLWLEVVWYKSGRERNSTVDSV